MLNEKLFIEEPLFELEEANEKYMPSVIARSLKKRKIGVNLRKKSPKSAKIANFGKKIKLSQAITQDEKMRVYGEFEDMKIWVKTLLEIYGSLPNIIKILDQIISSNAISPFGVSQACSINTFSQVEKVIDYCERKDKMLNIDLFNKEEKVIKEKIIQYILENIYDDDLMLVNDHHTMLIMDLINSRKANASVYLPNNIVVTKEYNKLFFSANIYESKDYEIEIIDYVCLPNGKEINRVESVESDSNFVCRLNSNDVCLPLHVRNRREGDKMIIKGLNGSKKIKDIFINEKISLRDRDLWPVVVDSKGVIVWLPGLKKSKFDKQKDEIYDIILKYS